MPINVFDFIFAVWRAHYYSKNEQCLKEFNIFEEKLSALYQSKLRNLFENDVTFDVELSKRPLFIYNITFYVTLCTRDIRYLRYVSQKRVSWASYAVLCAENYFMREPVKNKRVFYTKTNVAQQHFSYSILILGLSRLHVIWSIFLRELL